MEHPFHLINLSCEDSGSAAGGFSATWVGFSLGGGLSLQESQQQPLESELVQFRQALAWGLNLEAEAGAAVKAWASEFWDLESEEALKLKVWLPPGPGCD